MSSPTEDPDFEEYVNRQSDLSRRYRSLGSEEPPARIDAAVLAQARAALGDSQAATPHRRHNRARWMVPFAVAATVVLSFAIFRDTEVGTGIVPQRSAAPASTPAPLEFRESAEEALEATKRADAPAADALSNVVPDIAPPVPQASPPDLPISPPVDAPPTNAIQAVTTQRPPPPPPAPAARAPDVALFGGAPAAARTSAAEAERARASAADEALAAESWLEDIRALRAAGRHEQADAALQDFLQAYPDYFDRNPGIARP